MLETYLKILYYCKSEKNVCTSKAGAHAKKKNSEPRALSDIPELGWKEKFASVCIEVCIPADSQALHLPSFYSLKLMSQCHLNQQ